MTERARVIEVRDRIVTLQCFEHQGCSNCGSVFCNVKARTYDATLSDGIQVKPGDQVEVFVPPGRAIVAGFAVLIFPLLLFLAGYLAFGFLDSEPVRVGAGLGGMTAGFGIVYLAGRGRKKELPAVVRVFHGAELLPVRLPGSTASSRA